MTEAVKFQDRAWVKKAVYALALTGFCGTFAAWKRKMGEGFDYNSIRNALRRLEEEKLIATTTYGPGIKVWGTNGLQQGDREIIVRISPDGNVSAQWKET